MKDRILIWDLPTRIFHWTLAASFAGAFLTAESERWRDVHVMLGFTALGLVVFRLCWGLFGTRYARFAQFVRGPRAVLHYLRALWQRRPENGVGHNPAGAVAIVLLLGLGFGTALTGWLMASGRAGDALEEVHEALATAMLALVGVHVLAVIASSVLHRRNLVRAMVTGYQQGLPAQGIRSAAVAVGLVLAAALGGFWAYGLATQRLPFGLGAGSDGVAGVAVSSANPGRGDRDGDDD